MNATLAFGGELCWQIAKLPILGGELCASIRLQSMVSDFLCTSESRSISISTGPGWGIWVGRLPNGPFLATSSCASMRIPADFSLPYLVFVYQLRDVVKVTMLLSNVAALDSCKSSYINGVN